MSHPYTFANFVRAAPIIPVGPGPLARSLLYLLGQAILTFGVFSHVPHIGHVYLKTRQSIMSKNILGRVSSQLVDCAIVPPIC